MDSQVLDLFAIFFSAKHFRQIGQQGKQIWREKKTSSGKKIRLGWFEKKTRNEAQILFRAVAKIGYQLFPGMKTISRSETKMVKIKKPL